MWFLKRLNVLVGAARLELATSWSQTKRTAKLSYAPKRNSYSGPSGARTQDRMLMRHLL